MGRRSPETMRKGGVHRRKLQEAGTPANKIDVRTARLPRCSLPRQHPPNPDATAYHGAAASHAWILSANSLVRSGSRTPE